MRIIKDNGDIKILVSLPTYRFLLWLDDPLHWFIFFGGIAIIGLTLLGYV